MSNRQRRTINVKRPRRGRPGKVELDFDIVVDAALQMADDDGLEGLSMRKLADDLGAGVMSLYYYVEDKEALVDAIVDRVAAEVEPAPAEADWKESTRHLAMATHQALLRHPWAIPLWSSSRPGPHRVTLMEQFLAALASADLDADVVDLGFHAVVNHVQGFARQRVGFQTARSTDEARLRPGGLDVDLDEFPHVVAHIDYHRSGHGRRDEFAFVLDLILAGLERLPGS